MAAKTAAQEEFDNIFTKNADSLKHHPEDSDSQHSREELDEETQFKSKQIEETLKMPVFDQSSRYNFPDQAFDQGCVTGVKGVIADARSYEQAKRASPNWRGKLGQQIRDRTSKLMLTSPPLLEDKSDADSDSDEEFLEKWRESRRLEIQQGSDIRTRRTSPSVRRYGRFDEVDALGYLDAIEKVGRDTIVVVFVYDPDVCLPIHCMPTCSRLTPIIVPSVSSHRRSPHPSGCQIPRHPLCQGRLRSP